MAINTAAMLVAFAKQTAKGSGATTAGFSHGVASGKPFDLQANLAVDDLSTGAVMAAGAALESADPGADYETRMFAKSIGAYLFGVLGGKSVSGAGPYTHVIVPASSTPWWTQWGKLDAQWYKVIDSKLKGLSISWEGPGIIKVKPKWIGCTPSKVSAPTITNDEASAATFFAAGGTFKYDVDGATVATAPIVSGNIDIERGSDYERESASITPSNISDGNLAISGSLVLRPTDDTDLWAASNVSAAVYGSYEIALASGTDSVKLACTRANFSGGWPDYDKSGPSALVPFAFDCYGDANFTATVINALASY